VDPLFQQLGDKSHPDVQEIVLETMISQAVELGRNYPAVAKVARALDICNADGLTIRLATILRKVRLACVTEAAVLSCLLTPSTCRKSPVQVTTRLQR